MGRKRDAEVPRLREAVCSAQQCLDKAIKEINDMEAELESLRSQRESAMAAQVSSQQASQLCR